MPISSREVDYTEYPSSGPQPDFGATVTIRIPSDPVLQTRTFGSPQDRYPSKKVTRAVASKLAVQHLIGLGLLGPDGSVIKKPKGPSPIPAATGQSSADDSSDSGTSFSTRVPALAHKLGYTPPTYTITPTNPGGPLDVAGSAFCDCAASFPPITGLPNPIATVRNVYGKKRAKEDCAREVCAVLEKIIEQRLQAAGSSVPVKREDGTRVKSPTTHLGTGLNSVMDEVSKRSG